MNLRKIGWLFLLMALSLMLAACGGDDGGEAAGGGGGTATLPQSISSIDFMSGTLTVSYPEGWVADEADGAIYLANSAEALQNANTMAVLATLGENQVGGTVIFLSGPTALLDLEPNPTLTDALETFIATLESETGDSGIVADMGEPTTFTSNGKNGAIATGSAVDNATNLSLTVALVEEDDGHALLFFAAAPGQIEQFNDDIQTIAGSVDYMVGAVDATAEEAPAERTAEGTAEATPQPTPAG